MTTCRGWHLFKHPKGIHLRKVNRGSPITNGLLRTL